MTFIARTLGAFLAAFVLLFTFSLSASAALRLEQVDAISGSERWGPYKTLTRTAASAYPGRVGQGAGTFLESGDPVSFKLFPASNPILLIGGYRVSVPAGATELRIKLEIQTFDANVDLGVRFGQDLNLPLESNVDFLSASAGQADEEIVITPASSPALQEGTYFIGLILRTVNQTVNCKITATISGGTPAGTGVKLSSGQSQAFSVPAVTTPGISAGQGGFRIEVPQGTAQLRIAVNLDDPAAKIRILARHGFDVGLFDGNPVFEWESTGSSNSETLVITTNSPPALTPGTVYIALALDSVNVPFDGSITATTTPRILRRSGSPQRKSISYRNSAATRLREALRFQTEAVEPSTTRSPRISHRFRFRPYLAAVLVRQT